MKDPTRFEICLRRVELALSEIPPNEHKANSAIIQYCAFYESNVDVASINIIDITGVSYRTASVLESNGVTTVAEVLNMTFANLLKMRGIAKIEATKIRCALMKIGVRMKDY